MNWKILESAGRMVNSPFHSTSPLASISLGVSVGAWMLVGPIVLGGCQGDGEFSPKAKTEVHAKSADLARSPVKSPVPPRSAIAAFVERHQDVNVELWFDGGDISPFPPAMMQVVIGSLRLEKFDEYQLKEGMDAGVGYEAVLQVGDDAIKCNHGWSFRGLTVRTGSIASLMLTFRDESDGVRNYFYSRKGETVNSLAEGIWDLLKPLKKS